MRYAIARDQADAQCAMASLAAPGPAQRGSEGAQQAFAEWRGKERP